MLLLELSEGFPSIFLCLEDEESLGFSLLLAVLTLRPRGWLQALLSPFGLFWVVLAGFWAGCAGDADSGGGGSGISFRWVSTDSFDILGIGNQVIFGAGWGVIKLLVRGRREKPNLNA